jgi:WD40 repeat protein
MTETTVQHQGVPTRAEAESWKAARPPADCWPGHTNSGEDAAFSPDARHIVSASLDQTARVWNAANGQLLA